MEKKYLPAVYRDLVFRNFSNSSPLSEACFNVLKEIQKRNWSVQGFTTHFYLSPQTSKFDHKTRLRREPAMVAGKDFQIIFNNNVIDVILPKLLVRMFGVNGSISCYCYLGEDWDLSKVDEFRRLPEFELDSGAKRSYVYYVSWEESDLFTHAGVPDKVFYSVLMLADGPKANWYERRLVTEDQKHEIWKCASGEFDGGDVPQFLDPKKLEEHCVAFLQENVLDKIKSQPIPESVVDTLNEPEQVIPITVHLPPLFAILTPEQKNVLDTRGCIFHNRYGKFTGFPLSKVKLFDVMYQNNVLRCGVGRVDPKNPSSVALPDFWAYTSGSREGNAQPLCLDGNYLARITLLAANDVYIVDAAVYESGRKGSEIKQRSWRGKNLPTWMTDTLDTVVPINEYGGNYMKPVILVNRDCYSKEITIVGGPY